jgi:hypothetical protein
VREALQERGVQAPARSNLLRPSPSLRPSPPPPPPPIPHLVEQLLLCLVLLLQGLQLLGVKVLGLGPLEPLLPSLLGLTENLAELLKCSLKKGGEKEERREGSESVRTCISPYLPSYP